MVAPRLIEIRRLPSIFSAVTETSIWGRKQTRICVSHLASHLSTSRAAFNTSRIRDVQTLQDACEKASQIYSEVQVFGNPETKYKHHSPEENDIPRGVVGVALGALCFTAYAASKATKAYKSLTPQELKDTDPISAVAARIFGPPELWEQNSDSSNAANGEAAGKAPKEQRPTIAVIAGTDYGKRTRELPHLGKPVKEDDQNRLTISQEKGKDDSRIAKAEAMQQPKKLVGAAVKVDEEPVEEEEEEEQINKAETMEEEQINKAETMEEEQINKAETMEEEQINKAETMEEEQINKAETMEEEQINKAETIDEEQINKAETMEEGEEKHVREAVSESIGKYYAADEELTVDSERALNEIVDALGLAKVELEYDLRSARRKDD